MSEKTWDMLIHWGSAAAILIGGLIVIKILLRICMRTLKRTSLDEALHTFIINGLRVALYLVLAVTLLGYLGIPTSTFVAVLGAAGAAIALALKDSLGNVAGGIIILVTKPFGREDFIELNGITGVVESIDLLFTSLRTMDNKVIRVPNGTISTSVLINYSERKERRVDCTFGISYDDDIQKAKDLLASVAESCPQALLDPEPFIGVAGQMESCVNLDLKVWCKTDDYWTVKYFLEENVKLAFDEAGISIPFPQMDVHIKK